MCRLLGYLGQPLRPEQLIYRPEHSLIVQSYQPQEMTAGLLNADGFGLGWFDQGHQPSPYLYKNVLPIWSDINLPHLSRYIQSSCFVSYVRSATPPLAVDLTNCQPFTEEGLLFVHNGFINNFRTTLYRPLRNLLSDASYQFIHGTTDSEHIFALILDNLRRSRQASQGDGDGAKKTSLGEALEASLLTLAELARQHNTYFSANILLADGQRIVACRYASRQPEPSLYWLADSERCPGGVIVASEPLFTDPQWQACPPQSILAINSPEAIAVKVLADQ
ncbi:ergothioneine biosynthesis protein EgtC [Synechocystis sp. FACHB-383]|uniref:ergothioneine biosynthesis protein EgtC n=1 Tax=Synechocystis sp. FACHB-383 TaxID=2692864 RepID=UPI0016889B71|nr:ergothioneine biosynthesis protein EgtC [Synechocystis sp. FACHB-383]MBD2652756.1 ergothioneine biosynthesis protein EgtC [Synechocystis sp. FACHB-383]